ncbi:MAG: hypothetical protein ABR541_08065, partial [Candidatus Dormibacteria bacterium]
MSGRRLALAEARQRTRPRGDGAIGLVLQHDQVRLPDGATRALLRTENVDVDSLEPGRRAALLAAFARLCRTTEAPLQFCVRVRRQSAGSRRDVTMVLGADRGEGRLLASR